MISDQELREIVASLAIGSKKQMLNSQKTDKKLGKINKNLE